MRPFLVVTFLLQTIFSLPAHSQDIDSINRAVDSGFLKFNALDNRFQNLEDSLSQLKMEQALKEKGKTMDVFLLEMEEQERKEQRRLYLRIGSGIVFFVILIATFVRRRKRNSSATS